MSDDPIPVEVREFLLRCIGSVAQLEALVLLRSSPQQDWTVADLAHRLYVDKDEAAKILNGLVSCDLAAKDGTAFMYYTHDQKQQKLIDNVVQTYSRHLVPVTKLIHDKAVGIRKFADAFKFRGDI